MSYKASEQCRPKSSVDVALQPMSAVLLTIHRQLYTGTRIFPQRFYPRKIFDQLPTSYFKLHLRYLHLPQFGHQEIRLCVSVMSGGDIDHSGSDMADLERRDITRSRCPRWERPYSGILDTTIQTNPHDHQCRCNVLHAVCCYSTVNLNPRHAPLSAAQLQ
jgi:hypothetical protein